MKAREKWILEVSADELWDEDEYGTKKTLEI